VGASAAAIKSRDKTDGIKRPWTSSELGTLRELAAAGIGAPAIAEQLERTEASIRKQASAQRISLRTAGERRGMILGELPHGRLPDELREAVFLGSSDPVAASERSRRRAELCPACGIRDVSTRAGFCDTCYLRRLAAAHREEIATEAGRRELDAARALKYRARRATR
jgi:hypothetical protein